MQQTHLRIAHVTTQLQDTEGGPGRLVRRQMEDGHHCHGHPKVNAATNPGGHSQEHTYGHRHGNSTPNPPAKPLKATKEALDPAGLRSTVGGSLQRPQRHSPWDLTHGSGHGAGRSKRCFQAHHCFCAKMTQTGWEKPVVHREDEQLWKWEAVLTSGHGSGTRIPSPDFEAAVIGLQPRLCSAGASPP